MSMPLLIRAIPVCRSYGTRSLPRCKMRRSDLKNKESNWQPSANIQASCGRRTPGFRALGTRKRHIRWVTQPEFLQFRERMSFWRGQLDMLRSDEKLVQFRIGFWHEIEGPRIQKARSYSLYLFQTRCRLKLQFRIGLLLPELPEGIWNNTTLGSTLRTSSGTPLAIES